MPTAYTAFDEDFLTHLRVTNLCVALGLPSTETDAAPERPLEGPCPARPDVAWAGLSLLAMACHIGAEDKRDAGDSRWDQKVACPAARRSHRKAA
jgi:hypothetical protein